jgi:hypothetical protein
VIAALTLAEVMVETERQGCAWPECDDLADTNGFCRKHALRIARGRDVGCETPWEQLVVAALKLAGAEGDGEFDAAASRLKTAAVAYRRVTRPRKVRKDKGRPRSAPADEVERDIERARAKLEEKGIHVGGVR